MEINEMILRFKLRVIQDVDLRENAYNYVLRIKDMDTKKILADIGLYIQCKDRETTELKLLYGIILSYLKVNACLRLFGRVCFKFVVLAGKYGV